MRCSECSRRVRPIVAIDLDGTLGDYHGHLQRFAEEYWGVDLAGNVYAGDQAHRDYYASLGFPFREFREMKLAYRQGGQKRTMPVFAGAAELVNYLRAAGAEVWLTTTRPYLRLDGVDPDTREWLRRNGIEYDGLLYDEDKYRVLAEHVDPERVVAVLDDLPEQILVAAEAFGPMIPIWKRGVSNDLSDPVSLLGQKVSAVRDLADARTMIASRIAVWEAAR